MILSVSFWHFNTFLPFLDVCRVCVCACVYSQKIISLCVTFTSFICKETAQVAPSLNIFFFQRVRVYSSRWYFDHFSVFFTPEKKVHLNVNPSTRPMIYSNFVSFRPQTIEIFSFFFRRRKNSFAPPPPKFKAKVSPDVSCLFFYFSKTIKKKFNCKNSCCTSLFPGDVARNFKETKTKLIFIISKDSLCFPSSKKKKV